MGKSRFVKEVCYYFFSHNMFRFIIMYEELDKIKTKKQFKELMDKLNGQLR